MTVSIMSYCQLTTISNTCNLKYGDRGIALKVESDKFCAELLSFYSYEEISEATAKLFDEKSPWYRNLAPMIRKKVPITMDDLLCGVNECPETVVLFATTDRNFPTFKFKCISAYKATCTEDKFGGPGEDKSTCTDEDPDSMNLDMHLTFPDDQTITGKDLNGIIHELKVIKTLCGMEKKVSVQKTTHRTASRPSYAQALKVQPQQESAHIPEYPQPITGTEEIPWKPVTKKKKDIDIVGLLLQSAHLTLPSLLLLRRDPSPFSSHASLP